MNAQLSIIIVEYCSEEEIYKCINSISASLHVPYEIIVSSNSCYGEERQNAIRSKSANNVRWIFNEKNGGFAYAMNQGLKAATGKFLIIMNSDCIVGRGIDEMMLFMQQHPDIGAAGPQIKDNNGNILFVNEKGEITSIQLKKKPKNGAQTLKPGTTEYDAWLYDNKEVKEAVKKEFESGLAPDGATFMAA